MVRGGLAWASNFATFVWSRSWLCKSLFSRVVVVWSSRATIGRDGPGFTGATSIGSSCQLSRVLPGTVSRVVKASSSVVGLPSSTNFLASSPLRSPLAKTQNSILIFVSAVPRVDGVSDFPEPAAEASSRLVCTLTGLFHFVA